MRQLYQFQWHEDDDGDDVEVVEIKEEPRKEGEEQLRAVLQWEGDFRRPRMYSWPHSSTQWPIQDNDNQTPAKIEGKEPEGFSDPQETH